MKTLQQTQQIDTGALKKFAQAARRQLREQVAAQLDRVLKSDSAELREKEAAIKELKNQIALTSREAVIDRVAYTWFNRFCALRFMDVNRFTRMGTVSPADGFTQPEILAEAKQGHIDESIKTFINEQYVVDLLGGRITSRDPQQEAYRLLIVAACNYYNAIMPFLFERIADYTELLMPDDLLSDSSILAATRDTLTTDICKDVEVVGWLYQFYISEKKDEVFEDLKKNKKITPENIPAATQLFTPHWIVRYLVENSLGRLWLLNKPNSRLIDRMDYYTKPVQEEADFLRVSKPEELKICDPACGSGHMLVYAFDLLYAIYEEEGYETTEIPRLILQNNLYGIEIDERAGELAAFALVMKAREKYRRFFTKPVQPNICVLENIAFEDKELVPYFDAVGSNLFTQNLLKTLHQFRECDNFGSLIRPAATDVSTLRDLLEKKNIAGNIFLHNTHERVLKTLSYVDYLRSQYHVVIANPPYMGNKGMNPRLSAWASENYSSTKADFFAMFIERGLEMVLDSGYSAMVTMQSWMFLSSYEALRKRLIQETSIRCMAHMANMVMGIAFGTTATVWKKTTKAKSEGSFCYVEYADVSENNGPTHFPPQNYRNEKAFSSGQHDGFFHLANSDFDKIPGAPIAYWLSEEVRNLFQTHKRLEQVSKPRQGATTSDNNRFLRLWHEVSHSKFGVGLNSTLEAQRTGMRWFPYNKGGDFRRWYGNQDFVINYENDGEEIKEFHDELNKTRPGGRLKNQIYYFKECVSWSKISSGTFAVRYFPSGFIFDVAGSAIFFDSSHECLFYSGLLNTTFARYTLQALSPTLNFEAEHLCAIPVPSMNAQDVESVVNIVSKITSISRDDWNSSETSWDFQRLPLLQTPHCDTSVESAYKKLRATWQQLTFNMQSLETENNHLFLKEFGLLNQLSPDVQIDEISLSCNPYYRYGSGKSAQDLEQQLMADTVKDLISYAVGCMFGRYSIDVPGLILANQGDTKEHFLEKIPDPSFSPDDDNVIPILDGNWFSDDISDHFRKFVRLVFGDEHYQENLQFIENAIGKDIRKYFVKDFYFDHVKRYKKRPIYWLFSSPKGTFSALIYMHRYRPDTVSVVLNDYLREFRNKLSSKKNHLEAVTVSASVSTGDKTKALKEIETLKKAIGELDTYERDILYPLATEKVQIDLDDGVKMNYLKMGRALKTIPGMTREED